MLNQPTFLPSNWDNRNIIPRLNQTIEVAKALYASVAYWTIGTGILHPRLQQLLKHRPSFCCVDLHFPTNIDKILTLYDDGAHELFLYMRKVTNSSETRLHRHLLHTKLLLFDLSNGQAELWVGSHNFTLQALQGANREASVIIPLPQNSPLYVQAKDYLLAIRNEEYCLKFDPALIDQYKQLQGQDEADAELECFVLPLLWNSNQHPNGAANALAEQTALLLGDNPEVSKSLDQLYARQASLLVWAYDLATGRVSYWNARVQNASRIDRVNSSSNIWFGHPLLAILEDNRLPYLAPKVQELNQPLLRNFAHAASIWLYEEVTTRLAIMPPPNPKAKAHWIIDRPGTRELQQLSDELLNHISGYTNNQSGYLRPNDRDELGLNTEGWLANLEEEAAKKQRARNARRLPAPKLPVVKRPVFAVPDPETPTDPLRDLQSSLTEADRHALQMRYEKPLRARYFGDQRPSQGLILYSAALPNITLDKLVIKYRLLIH